ARLNLLFVSFVSFHQVRHLNLKIHPFEILLGLSQYPVLIFFIQLCDELSVINEGSLQAIHHHGILLF
ncbi:MAG: hypothetical protein ACK55Z_37240, partial [bacterium]